MYRGGRPNRVAALLNRVSAIVASAGLWPNRLVTLEVRGRRTGRLISFPLMMVNYEGERYLVAMLGERTNWFSNVRAAGGHAVLRHGRREVVRLEEVDAHNGGCNPEKLPAGCAGSPSSHPGGPTGSPN
jgi:F420H(2)-dependent quinone reductase